MIIDMHQRLGDDEVFDAPVTEAELTAALDANGVDRALVHPAPGAPGDFARVVGAHNRIAALAAADARVFGVCSASPHAADYENEVARCIGDLGFVALRADPLLHVWNPLSKKGRLPFELAARHKVPLLIPLGEPGHPLVAPLGVFDLVKEFSAVKVVLQHTGAAANDVQCGLIAKRFGNVLLETSAGPNRRVLKTLVKQYGAERVLFGSSHVRQLDHALWMYRNAGLDGADLNLCLGGNAARLFGWAA